MATAGYPLLLERWFVTLVLAQLGLTALTLAALVATFCIAGFFRDPDRVIPNRPGIVVSRGRRPGHFRREAWEDPFFRWVLL